MLHDTMLPTDIRKYRPDIHPELARLIHQCMEVDPARRPATAQRIAQLIEGVEGAGGTGDGTRSS
jgi:serine/threonine-protein kinase